MSGTGVAESFRATVRRPNRRRDLFRVAAGLVTGSAVIPLAISAAFAIGDGARPAITMITMALVCGGATRWLLATSAAKPKLGPVPALAGLAFAYLVLVLISTVIYLGSGAIDRVDDALYESTAGVATSALTLFADPSGLGDGVLVWRSATQWLGGFGALAASAALLPFLGGSRELADPRDRNSRHQALAERPLQAFKRVAAIYGAVSLVVMAAYWAVGLGLRDGIVHSFSTVSTGGFSPYPDSIAHFDSLAVELVTVVAMAGAGISLALVWMLSRGQLRDTLRAFELRVFAAMIVAVTGWVWWLTADERSWFEELIESMFTVVALATTTGHRIADWGSWHPGAVTILSVILVVGGMAGSVAGGLRWIRVVVLFEFVWRELQRQLHPRSVRSVRAGHSTISEGTVDRMHAQLVFTMMAGVTGALFLAGFGASVVEAVSLASSAVATVGPALAEGGGTITDAADLSRLDRLVLIPLMLAGRVAIYPVLVLGAVAVFATSRRVSAHRFRRGLSARRSL